MARLDEYPASRWLHPNARMHDEISGLEHLLHFVPHRIE
jgi:hypothetical protein